MRKEAQEVCSCSAREVVDRLRRGDVTPLDLLSVLGPPVRFPWWPLNVEKSFQFVRLVALACLAYSLGSKREEKGGVGEGSEEEEEESRASGQKLTN